MVTKYIRHVIPPDNEERVHTATDVAVGPR
jgi:hypothetical protein